MTEKFIFRLYSHRACCRNVSSTQSCLLQAWGCLKCYMHPNAGIPFISTETHSRYIPICHACGSQNACSVRSGTCTSISYWDKVVVCLSRNKYDTGIVIRCM